MRVSKMEKNEQDVIEQTVEFWKKRTGRDITREDAREMIHNVSGFFQILAEWDRKNRNDQESTVVIQENSL